MKIGRHKIEITHPRKIIYSKEKIDKEQVVDYYKKIAPYFLPHSKDRPINMQRFPQGAGKKGFYQKEIPDYFPNFVKRVQIKIKSNGYQKQVMINNISTLIYLANQDCLTPHLWLVKKNNLYKPNRIIYDIDPPHRDYKKFAEVKYACKKLKTKLEEHKLHPYLMLTGSYGAHVVVPIIPDHNFTKVRAFAKKISQELVDENPKKFTLEVRKNKRRGKIFLDYLRNAYAQTTVAPYCLRARPSAPVATPIDWNELNKKNINSQYFTIKNIFRRLAVTDDPWKNINKSAKKIKL